MDKLVGADLCVCPLSIIFKQQIQGRHAGLPLPEPGAKAQQFNFWEIHGIIKDGNVRNRSVKKRE